MALKLAKNIVLKIVFIDTICCAFSIPSGVEDINTSMAHHSPYIDSSISEDSRFVTHNNTVVTAQVGATAILHCKTSSATGGLVSWIRKRDYQLLTVGLKTHSSDERFSINYIHWDWQLHIRYVQPRDKGSYECQVSSHPPASIFVHLLIVEAKAEILGAPEKHVKAGSILRLVCILHHTTEAPSYVFWYRGHEMINYNEEQSVVVESDEHTSVLLVTKATRQHSGNYSCVPSNAKPASILVHILNGEYPAAMQHGSCLTNSASIYLVFAITFLTLFLSFLQPSHWSSLESTSQNDPKVTHITNDKSCADASNFFNIRLDPTTNNFSIGCPKPRSLHEKYSIPQMPSADQKSRKIGFLR